MVNFAEGGECRHSDILIYFNDKDRIKKCGHCDSCAPNSERKVIPTGTPFDLTRVKKKSKKEKAKALFKVDIPDDKKWMIDVLKDWRKSYAQENSIPAFMVFSDKTLRDLVLKSPNNKEDLAEVYGFGDKKVDALGELVLSQINP